MPSLDQNWKEIATGPCLITLESGQSALVRLNGGEAHSLNFAGAAGRSWLEVTLPGVSSVEARSASDIYESSVSVTEAG